MLQTRPRTSAGTSINEAAPRTRRGRPRSSTTARSVKAHAAAECSELEQLPNIGPSLAANLRSIGIATPQHLCGRDGFELYQQLCRSTGRRQDPCVLDTFLAIVDFMHGAAPAPWWRYTADRKRRFGQV